MTSSRTREATSARRTALIVTILAGAAFVLVAWWRIPWHPVPGGEVVPADPARFLSGADIDRAEDYARWARVWSWGSLLVSLAVAAWWGFTDVGRRVVERLPGRWWWRTILAVALTVLLGRLITLPFAVAFRQHARDYGITRQSWWGFARDLLVGEGVQIVVTAIAVLVLLACVRRFPRRWPAVVGGLLGALVMTGSFLYPVLVEPLFNSFEPLPDGSLRTGILRLAETEQVRVDDVLVADASRRTTTLNAYVSGFGDTRRVVLYDNLVEELPQDEVLAVVAHELTHARHDDVLTGSLLGALGAVIGVGVLGLLLERRPAGEPSVVPRVLAMFAIASVLTAPVQNGLSRLIETRADVGALEATRDPGAFIAMQQELNLHAVADPTPPAWSHFWFGSHPTTMSRVAVAERFEELLRDR